MAFGLLLLRMVAGGLLAGHGLQKLYGWFGGGGIQGTGAYFGSLGFVQAKRWAIVGGLTETLGGLSLLLGFLTPLGAAMIIGAMTAAAVAAHAPNGLWNANGGYELPLVNGTIATMLAFGGPGPWSVDGALDLGLTGTFFGFAALTIGLLTGLIVASFREPARETVDVDVRRRAA